jgi:leucyl-tRNA synthetase
VKIACSVNGKVRDVLEVEKGLDDAKLQALALALPKIKAYTDGHTIKKVIVVKDRIVNIVVG